MAAKFGDGQEQGTNRTLDPVCGKRVDSDPNGVSAEYKKRRYYFCSEKCRKRFETQTEKFRLNELARAGALFTPAQVRWGMA
ncbi:MAG: YHS domain-containing protein [Myxococcaceae bacterium]